MNIKKITLIAGFVSVVVSGILTGCGSSSDGEYPKRIDHNLSQEEKDVNAYLDSIGMKDSFIKIAYDNYYTVEYSPLHKGPRKVTYTLKGENVNKKNIQERPPFYPESAISRRWQALPEDYLHTGLDRGHLAPDASFDWSENSLYAVYTMANITPQYPIVNRTVWKDLEKRARDKALIYDEIKVTNYVEYKKKQYLEILQKEPKRAYVEHKYKIDRRNSAAKEDIVNKKIFIPTGFYKILENKEYGFKECFYVPNRKFLESIDWRDYGIDCNR